MLLTLPPGPVRPGHGLLAGLTPEAVPPDDVARGTQLGPHLLHTVQAIVPVARLRREVRTELGAPGHAHGQAPPHVHHQGPVKPGKELVGDLPTHALVPREVTPAGAGVGERLALVDVPLVPSAEDDREGARSGTPRDASYPGAMHAGAGELLPRKPQLADGRTAGDTVEGSGAPRPARVCLRDGRLLRLPLAPVPHDHGQGELAPSLHDLGHAKLIARRHGATGPRAGLALRWAPREPHLLGVSRLHLPLGPHRLVLRERPARSAGRRRGGGARRPRPLGRRGT